MNRWTLKFNNQALEKKYQLTFNDKRNMITFKAALVSSVLLYIGKLVSDVVNNSPTHWSFLLPGFIIACFASVVVFRYPKYSQNALIFLNYSFSISQCWVDSTYDQQRSFVLGSNIMGIQMILMMTLLDFPIIVPQIIFQAIVKLIICSIIDKLRIVSILFSLVVALCQMLVYYKCIQAQRKQFLLNIKEDYYGNKYVQSQVQFLPRFIETPFILFQYKDEQFQPMITHQTKGLKRWDLTLCDGCNLRSLLRIIKREETSLENNLLQRIKKKLSLNKSELEDFSFHSQGFGKIQIIEITTEKWTFMIKFSEQSRDKVNKLEISKINHFYRLIRGLFQYLQKPKKNKVRLFELSLFYISGFYLTASKVENFSPLATMQQILKFIGSHNIILNYSQHTETHCSVGEKNQFSVFFLQVFRILIIINQKQEFSEIGVKLISDNTLEFTIYISTKSKSKFLQLYKKNPFIQRLELKLFSRKLDVLQNSIRLQMKHDIDHQFQPLI